VGSTGQEVGEAQEGMTIDDLIEILYRCAKQFIALIEKKRAELK
jgi:hypothetical protein